MPEQHPLERYVKAKSAAEVQTNKVRDIVDAIYSEASKLHTNWRKAHFSGEITTGEQAKPTTADKHLIVNLDVLRPDDAYRAITEWKAAESELKAAIEGLTPEERRTLGIRPV